MTFTIQINVGVTVEEIQHRILEDLGKHERGEAYVVQQLDFLNWDMFYAMLSPKGLSDLRQLSYLVKKAIRFMDSQGPR